MKPTITAIATIFLTLHSLTAQAAQWVTVGGGSDSYHAVDIDSIKGEGNVRTYWSNLTYVEEQQRSYKKFQSVKSLNYVDCATQQIGVLRIIYYSPTGGVVDTIDESYRSVPSRLSTVVPDSIGESELKYVCGRRSNAGIQRGKATVSSGQGRIDRQQAVDVILKWLNAKNEIFAPPFSRSLIDQLTTGKLRNDLTTSGSPTGWLRQNNAYYKYGTPQIGAVEMFATSANKVTIQVKVTEDRALYKNGLVDQSETGIKTNKVRYYLELTGNTWKIADYQVLD